MMNKKIFSENENENEKINSKLLQTKRSNTKAVFVSH